MPTDPESPLDSAREVESELADQARTQHTPGPVEAKRVDMVNAVIYGSDGMLIAKMAPHEHAWERAQYIAGTLNAAPELLDALNAAQDRLNALRAYVPEWMRAAYLLDKDGISAALAKARP